MPKKHFLDDCESGYFECYEAGAASWQAEVDELQKRIDEAINLLQGKSIGEVYKAIHILKGKKDE